MKTAKRQPHKEGTVFEEANLFPPRTDRVLLNGGSSADESLNPWHMMKLDFKDFIQYQRIPAITITQDSSIMVPFTSFVVYLLV